MGLTKSARSGRPQFMDVLTKVQIAPQSRANPKFDKGGQVDWKRGPIEMEAKEREVPLEEVCDESPCQDKVLEHK